MFQAAFSSNAKVVSGAADFKKLMQIKIRTNRKGMHVKLPDGITEFGWQIAGHRFLNNSVGKKEGISMLLKILNFSSLFMVPSDIFQAFYMTIKINICWNRSRTRNLNIHEVKESWNFTKMFGLKPVVNRCVHFENSFHGFTAPKWSLWKDSLAEHKLVLRSSVKFAHESPQAQVVW